MTCKTVYANTEELGLGGNLKNFEALPKTRIPPVFLLIRSLVIPVEVDDAAFSLDEAAPVMRIHLLRSSTSLKPWTMEVCVAVLMRRSVQFVNDLPCNRLLST